MKIVKKILLILLIVLFPMTTYAKQISSPWFMEKNDLIKQKPSNKLSPLSISGETTPGSIIKSGEIEVFASIDGNYKIYPSWLKLLNQPENEGKTEMDVEGPIGGKTKRIVSFADTNEVEQNISERVIDYKLAGTMLDEPELETTLPKYQMAFLTGLLSSAPEILPFLPQRCQYLNIGMTGLPFPNDNLLFNPPKWQDINDASQIVRTDYDGINVLKIREAHVKRDYEGPNEPGGFYSNVHFGVIPYHPVIGEWYEQCEAAGKVDTEESCQKLLLVASGHTKRNCEEEGNTTKCETEKEITQQALNELYATDNEDVDSSSVHRIHGFLMGPFFTHDTKVALLNGELEEEPQCEWGDTDMQIPEQNLKYTNLGVWDWDYDIDYYNGEKKVYVIAWEGDDYPVEGDVILAGFVGEGETKIITNADNDFTIKVVTGDTSFNPRSFQVSNIKIRSPLERKIERANLKKDLLKRGLIMPIPDRSRSEGKKSIERKQKQRWIPNYR